MSDPSLPARPDNNYRLVFFHSIDEPDAVRELICGVTGLHPTDANQWIARAPGIVRHPLAEGEIRELLDGLYELGVAAEAWRVDSLPTLTPMRVVHDMAFAEGGFQVKGLRGEPVHWVPWNKVELIAAGKIAQEDEVRAVQPPNWVQGVSMGLNAVLRRPQVVARRQRTFKLTREPVGEAIIVRKDPRIALRIVEGQMKYTCLGDRRQNAASANFPILLGELTSQAKDAFITRTTEALVAGEPVEEYLFGSAQDLIDYATVRLIYSWYRRDRQQSLTEPEPEDEGT